MTVKSIISKATYVLGGGSRCPFCFSNDLELTGSYQSSYELSDGKVVTQGVKCNNCGKEWDDRYELVGFEEVQLD